MTVRRRAFFFHYNKPASLRQGRTVISLHHAGACHLVNSLYVSCPVTSRARPRPPKFVMVGRAREVRFEKIGEHVHAVVL